MLFSGCSGAGMLQLQRQQLKGNEEKYDTVSCCFSHMSGYSDSY